MILKLCLLFLLLCSTILVESRRLGKNRQKMIIDQDAGADDAMAILMALLYEEYFQGPQVVALTTVNGNVNETQGFINTQRILDVADRRDIPIFRGADSALVTGHPTDEYFGTDGLGDVEQTYDPIQAQCLHAALAIIEYSKKYRGELVLVTLGTLTNLALALKLDPKLLDRLKHVYVGAGNLYDEAFPLSTQVEFNVQLDVEAYKVLTDYATSEKVTVVPFSQIRRYYDITTDWRVNTLGAIPTKEIEAMNQFESVNIPKDDMWQLLDPVVMALALDKSLFDDIRLTKNSVVLCGDGASEGLDRRGITLNDLDAKEEYNMKLAYNGSVDDFKDFLYRVFSEPIRHGRNGG